MNKDDIQLLFTYDRWANQRVLRAATALSAEQFARDLHSSFHSVRETLLHIIGGEWIWLNYWNGSPRGPELIAALRKQMTELLAKEKFPGIAEVSAQWSEVEREQVRFVAAQTDESLAMLVPFRNTEVKLGLLMQHLANHSTYHRGQIASMMRQLGVEPVPTDFHVFLLEGLQAV